jgi:hypothetical protein
MYSQQQNPSRTMLTTSSVDTLTSNNQFPGTAAGPSSFHNNLINQQQKLNQIYSQSQFGGGTGSTIHHSNATGGLGLGVANRSLSMFSQPNQNVANLARPSTVNFRTTFENWNEA